MFNIRRTGPNSENAVVLLKTEGETALPDFTGWSKKMVLSFKMLSGLDIRINGEGFVTEQSLSQGTVIRPEMIRLSFSLQSPAEIYKPKVRTSDEESIVGG